MRATEGEEEGARGEREGQGEARRGLRSRTPLATRLPAFLRSPEEKARVTERGHASPRSLLNVFLPVLPRPPSAPRGTRADDEGSFAADLCAPWITGVKVSEDSITFLRVATR